MQGYPFSNRLMRPNILSQISHLWNDIKRRASGVGYSSTMAPSDALLELFGIPTGGRVNYSWTLFCETYYKRNPIVYSCIRKISEAAQAVDIKIMYGEEDELPSQYQPLQDLFDRPNPLNSSKQFVDTWITQMHIAGVSYIYRNNTSPMGEGSTLRFNSRAQLQLIRPDRMEPMHDSFELTGYKLDNKQTIPPEQINMIRFIDPADDFLGVSPLLACAIIIEAYSNGQMLLHTTLKNGGVPPGILKILGNHKVTEETIDELYKRFGQRYRQAAKDNLPMPIYGESGEYQRLGQTLTELNIADAQRALSRDICNCLGMPSQLIGDPDTSKYSNLKEAYRAFYTDKVLPDMQLFASEMTEWLLEPIDKNLRVELDTSGVEVLSTGKTELAARLMQSDWLTINDKREEDDREPVEGGDVLYQPFNLVPLGSELWDDEEDSGARSIRHTRSDVDLNKTLPYVDPRSKYPTLADRLHAISRIDKIKIPKERRFAGIMKTYFKEQGDDLADAFVKYATEGISGRSGQDKPPTHKPPPEFVAAFFADVDASGAYRDLTEEFYRGLIIDFGQDAIDQFMREGILFDTSRPSIRNFLTRGITERSRIINQTTADRLQRIIDRGVSESVSTIEIKNRILDEFTNMSVGRARAIAQTEVGHAAGIATQQGHEQIQQDMGVALQKEWVTSRDGSVRDAHDYMDGQVRAVDSMFDGPGGQSSMQVPPDSGDPAFDINCRCLSVLLGPGDEPI